MKYHQQGDLFWTDIEKAKHLFLNAGLAFPTIPDELGVQLRERDKWLFSTRELDLWPYFPDSFIDEFNEDNIEDNIEDYVILSHSGHGANSYASQYYLVYGKIAMFLHLAWGGIYMDNKKAASDIRDSYSLADEIVLAAQTSEKIEPGRTLMIVGSDFYGGYWSLLGKKS